MRIKVLAVEIKEVKEGKKDYKLMEVSYKNLEFNKVEGKKIVSFASPDVFNALKDANPGDEFDVTKGEKSAAGFVPWTRCAPAGEGTGEANTAAQGGATTPSRAASSPRSTYETPEERAKKQVLIVKQSSLSNAISFLDDDPDKDVNKVLETARIFENYVFAVKDPVKALMEMPDDIPF